MLLSPISEFDGWCAKREDMAGFVSPSHPSGSKVRQYQSMALSSPGSPMIVGCASYSAMQVYVASAAHLSGVPAYVFVPERRELTEATKYALGFGSKVSLVPAPAWSSVLRKRARDFAKGIGKTVRWNPDLALKDTMEQCANIPDWVRRVIVPTGSGLTASGVLAGMAQRKGNVTVMAVSVSAMAREDDILDKASEAVNGAVGPLFNHSLPGLILKRVKAKYGTPVLARLPDGTPLDPWYAAKALEFVKDGDCLWVPGLRPVNSMPKRFQVEFKDWQGFI